jgi:hypothetical protein
MWTGPDLHRVCYGLRGLSDSSGMSPEVKAVTIYLGA